MLRVAVKKLNLCQMGLKPNLWLFSRSQTTSAETAPAQEEEKIKVIVEETDKEAESSRLAAFRKKMKEDMAKAELDGYTRITPKDDDALPPWPDNVNPHTGEVGGPRGPEPTRYGDWERKGICVDF